MNTQDAIMLLVMVERGWVNQMVYQGYIPYRDADTRQWGVVHQDGELLYDPDGSHSRVEATYLAAYHNAYEDGEFNHAMDLLEDPDAPLIPEA